MNKRKTTNEVQTQADTKKTTLTELFEEIPNSSLVVIGIDKFIDAISFTLNIVENAGLQKGKGIAMFSLDLSSEQLVERMLCSKANIDNQKLKTDNMQSTDWRNLKSAVNDLKESSLWLDCKPNIDLVYICNKCKEQKQQYKNLELVVIDNLQLLSKKDEQDLNDYSVITKELKNLADELDIKIILTSQISHRIRQKQNKKQMMFELNNSIMQNADVVMFIYKENYDNNNVDDVTKILVAKNNFSKTDTINLAIDTSCTHF